MDLYERIKMKRIDFIAKYRSKLKIALIVFYIFEGVFIFPLSNYWKTYNFVNIMLLFSLGYAYFLLGNFSKRIYSGKKLKPIAIFFTSNCIGFILRALLEWGEYTFTNDLTLFNWLSTYGLITLVFIFGLNTKTLYLLKYDDK
mgnify:CR=1 FL=1